MLLNLAVGTSFITEVHLVSIDRDILFYITKGYIHANLFNKLKRSQVLFTIFSSINAQVNVTSNFFSTAIFLDLYIN